MTTQIQNPAYRLSVLLFAGLTPVLSVSAPTEPLLRVRMVRLIPPVPTLTVSAPAGLRFAGDSGVRPAPASLRFAVSGVAVHWSDERGNVLAAAASLAVSAVDGGPVSVAWGSSGRSVRLRGCVEVGAVGASLGVTNLVGLEDYVRGVVAAEMPPTAPDAALRAQAVASRTFALRRGWKAPAGRFELDDTPMSQVYGGVGAERPATDRAVADTRGLVLKRSGRLIVCDFYDDCGGVTSPGSGAGDYPPSVRDIDLLGREYCAGGTHHTWRLEASAADLLARLPAKLRDTVGRLTEMTVCERDLSGRAVRVRLEGERGEATIGGPALRAALGYERLRSTLFDVTGDPASGFVFAGRGNGHGHGMCQWGAIGMASPPSSATLRQILQHYYPGAELTPWGDGETPR